MAKSVDSLWPETIGTKPLPGPANLLQDQGAALEEKTGGKLYGEVVQPRLPSINAITFDFYIGVVDRPIRHKLLSLECGLLFDYPVTIQNHEAGTTLRVSTEQDFRTQVQLILNSNVTQELLGRLLVFAK